MNQFYISLIFIGIILIVIALVGVAYDRKKAYDQAKLLDAKRGELVEIISDAEQMVDELNKFSDYIVTKMDLKNEEMLSTLRNVEARINQAGEKLHEKSDARIIPDSKVVNGNLSDIRVTEITQPFPKSDLIVDKLELSIDAQSLLANKAEALNKRSQARAKDKVIPINNKYKEVIRLANEGLSDVEIAKKLNMGKGEIQLVLDMNR